MLNGTGKSDTQSPVHTYGFSARARPVFFFAKGDGMGAEPILARFYARFTHLHRLLWNPKKRAEKRDDAKQAKKTYVWTGLKDLTARARTYLESYRIMCS